MLCRTSEDKPSSTDGGYGFVLGIVDLRVPMATVPMPQAVRRQRLGTSEKAPLCLPSPADPRLNRAVLLDRPVQGAHPNDFDSLEELTDRLLRFGQHF